MVCTIYPHFNFVWMYEWFGAERYFVSTQDDNLTIMCDLEREKA